MATRKRVAFFFYSSIEQRVKEWGLFMFEDFRREKIAIDDIEINLVVGCEIRSTLDTHSGIDWTPIPELTGQSFRY
jgi:hypothetical protein